MRKKKTIKINFLTFIIYLAILLFLELFLYMIIGIGLLSFLGFQYESYLNAIIFLITCYIFMIPVDYYTSLVLSLFRNKSKTTHLQERCIDFIIYFTLSSLVVGICEYIIPGITISPANQVLFVFLYYMLEVCCEYLLIKKV